MHRHRNLRIRRGGIAGDGLDYCCLSRNLVLRRNRLGLPVGGCRKAGTTALTDVRRCDGSGRRGVSREGKHLGPGQGGRIRRPLRFAVSYIQGRDIDGQRRHAQQSQQRERNQDDGYSTFVFPTGSVYGDHDCCTLQFRFSIQILHDGD